MEQQAAATEQVRGCVDGASGAAGRNEGAARELLAVADALQALATELGEETALFLKKGA
ncbi:hypothetical protein [Niveispirillum sp. SYP-B3756]|uniref:hypothetical protein n=1 Tax=Niveispirillum sp. SYP-B3756 TaxID=2662178 RepID=UPI0012918EC1|nr:hypothetical protein [Niveispirillum sp. SYP-B3756]